MNKLIVAFMLAFFLGALLSGIAEGGNSLSSTRLTTAIGLADTTLTVRSTEGFKDVDYVEIDDEKISFNGKTATTFTYCERGYNNSTPATHEVGAMVYSPEVGAINATLGFTVVDTGATAGTINMMLFPYKFVTITAPKLISWDFDYLKEGDAQYLRYFLWCISVGFIFSIVYLILSALGGVAQSIFRRT